MCHYFSDLTIAPIEFKDDAKNAIEEITQKLVSLNKELKEQKATYDTEEKSLQVFVDECRDALVSLFILIL